MKKRITSMFLVLLMVLSLMPATVQASPASSGSGTKADPYLIATAQDLIEFRDEVNALTKKSTSTLCAKLTKDIDLSNLEGDWEPIGKATNTYKDYVAYGGTFDGDGHTIAGLSINATTAYQGLFGYVKGGEIKDLTVAGSVTTSTTSSAYAAGIVGYGSPVTIENCVNQATVTATKKGYIAGIVGYTSTTGSSISGCTNQGAVSGAGDYVGGIVGTANNTVIKNCINSAEIVDTGKPGGYSYCVGGIAGAINSSSSIERSGNTGKITSTLKRTGGVVGSAAGTVQSCFNTGDVTGIYSLGGIAGGCASSNTKITDCYNWGKVESQTPTSAFNDTATKGVGGVVGDPCSASNSGSILTNCYNAGTIVNKSTIADIVLGGVIGSSSGNNYSGTTTNLITAQNCYYLSADGLNGDGANADASGITAKTADELKVSDMAGLLGSSYISQTDNYPILGWQDPNAEYTVTFAVTPDEAKLIVKQNDMVIAPKEDGSYALKNGTYTYEVSAPECQTETGSFTVAYGGQTITVALKEALYDVVFTTVPADAELTVAGRTPEADGRTYRLPKSGNPYSYTLKAFGYEEKTGSFSVTGDKAKDAQNISMTELAKQKVTFGDITAADGKAITPVITVTCPEWPGENLQAQADGSYALPAGTYNYVISCSGYKSVKGSFTVEAQAVQIQAYTLEVQTAWDGENYTEPQKNESGAYLIGSPDELMWFDKHAQMTDSAVLTADITINEDVNAEATGLYKWTPIGWYKDYSSSAKYTGTFDGDGHTISGLYVSMTGSGYTSNYVGLFGYAGTDSKISNLTITDSKIEASGSYRGNNVGAIAGNAYDIENCHVTDSVTVTGSNYVGGVAGSVDNSITASSNAGTVTATANRAGGVTGRVQSNKTTAMTECYNSGSVKGASLVGGLVGDLYNGGTISDCYNTGAVTATTGVAGGLTGNFRSGVIKNTYTSITPSATNAGSVAGKLEWASGQKTLDQVFVLQSELNTVGNLNSCTIQTGDAQKKTTEELKALASTLGDKFTEDSENSNQGYPILKWQAGSDEPDPDQPVVDPAGWDGHTATQPAQENGIYQISTAAELKWFADAAKATTNIQGVLKADVNLNHQAWTPIGGTTADSAFAGILDGAGYTVKNLYCKTNGEAGLFAWNKGTIKNLKVTGKVISGDCAAAIASQNQGTIENCIADAAVTGGNYTAGITGENNGIITSCTNQGAVSGAQYVGGIAGENTASKNSTAKISGCINTGMIRATGYMAGGIAGNNDGYGENFAAALIENVANSGHIINTDATMRSYAGGCVGRNNGKVDKLYNSGSVESMGGCVGGTLGLNVTKAEKSNLYNIGDVTGGDFEDDGYPTDNQVSSESELAQAKNQMTEVLTRLGSKEAISGTLSINGTAEVEATVTAQYTGDQTGLIYIWYYSYDENDDVVLAITEKPEYKIPQNMAGRKLRVKALCADASGVLKAETESAVKGLTGSLKIEGAPVVGRTLTAVFKSSDSVPVKYQWYQEGKTPIEGATGETYTVTAADQGKVLTVRVTSDQVAGMLEASTKTVTTAADADMWESAQCTEPANVGGVYMIGTEKELHWFASEVNGGNTAISGKLLNDIKLTTDNWYPIGRSGHAYAGTFDGNGKHITNLKITSTKDETGFFGLIAGGGKVKSLNLSGTVTVTGDVSQTGGIAGAMEDVEKASSITDCSFSGSVSGNIQVGGIVGCVGLHNNVERCSNTAAVSGKELIGGIAGANSYGNIRYCRNTGTVGNDKAEQVGGIVGAHQNYAELIASYNTGEVKGADYIGGIAGNVYVASMPLGCYNVGSVSSGMHCGGAVGSFGGDDYITIKKGSFYQGPLSAAYQANGAKMRSAEDMKKESFVSELNADAYVTCYTKDTQNKNNGYPILTWEVDGFQVTFNANGGDCDITDVNVAVNGSLNELPTPYRWNYKFDGWFTEKDGGEAITTETKFNADTVLYAHWTLIRPSTGEQNKKTVYFSLSLDGKYVTGNDADSTLLAMVPVDVEYFDLSAYDLQKYMITENGAPVEQPTVLHLMIQMLEKYYLSDGSRVTNNSSAMTVTGGFSHMYFQKFWGHGENLTYFLNHQYPLMKPGMGATADYMTLEDGDVIDVAMYSNNNFYKDANAGFPYFTLTDGTAAEQMEMTASEPRKVVLRRGWANMNTGEPTDMTVAGAKVYYTTDPSLPKEQWTEMGTTRDDGSIICRFPDAGTQYLMVEGTDVSAPAICKVMVQPGAEQLPDQGYALSVSGGSASLPIGDDVQAVITVKSKDEITYNAYDLTVTYDPAVLTYKGINDANVSNLKVTDDGSGTLRITGYGEDRTVGIDSILLTFTGNAAGESNITVTAAKIDKSEHATTADAPNAQILNDSCKVTVENIHRVTLVGEIHGDSTVKDGTDYRINLNDQHYDYEITAQMNGQNVTAEKKTDTNGEIYYNIGNVTGDLNVTATRTPKTYTITTDGTGKEDLTAAGSATYLQDYTFTVDKKYGYTYLVTVKKNGEDCPVSMDADQKTYTIAGINVTGDIQITVSKEVDMSTRTKINFTGNGSGNVTGGTTQLAMRNQEFTFEMTATDVYEYTLKLADGTVLTPEADGKTYKIPASKVTGEELNVTAERKGIITQTVSKYLDLGSEKAIWLVTASGAVDDGNILTYDTHSMYWSTNYQAYAYLLISDKSQSEVEAEAAGKVQEAAGTKQTLAYDYDVNGTGTVGINDVQLIYNMYNAMYENFDMATMEKFLNADVNNDRKVNVLDASQAVQEMIKRNK